MKIYKLSVTGEFGFEQEAYYYRTLSKAKKAFRKKLRQLLKNRNTVEKIYWTKGGNKKENSSDKKTLRKGVIVPFCGSENEDIVHEEIQLENIKLDD